MAIRDIFKRTIPRVGTSASDSDGPANIQTAFESFSSSLHAPIPVGSLTEANQIAVAAPAEAYPLFIYRTDETALYVRGEKTSGEWIFVGGRSHAIELNLYQGQMRPNTYNPLGIKSIIRMSAGWNIAPGAYANDPVIPADGMYQMQVRLSVAGAGETLGRAFGQFTINDVPYRHEVSQLQKFSFGITKFLAAGDQVRCHYYHSDTSTTHRVLESGEWTITHVATPRWEPVS